MVGAGAGAEVFDKVVAGASQKWTGSVTLLLKTLFFSVNGRLY
jgi:hypothetical protein